jgi:peptidyl-tRNA hydrolase
MKRAKESRRSTAMGASKLFLITRADLSDGQQAVQAAHAMREFAEHHPEVERTWYRESNTLAFLVVPDEPALGVLLKKARRRDVPAAVFREPDRNNEMTAIALGSAARSLVSNLPLALTGSHSSMAEQRLLTPRVAGSTPVGTSAPDAERPGTRL